MWARIHFSTQEPKADKHKTQAARGWTRNFSRSHISIDSQGSTQINNVLVKSSEINGQVVNDQPALRLYRRENKLQNYSIQRVTRIYVREKGEKKRKTKTNKPTKNLVDSLVIVNLRILGGNLISWQLRGQSEVDHQSLSRFTRHIGTKI